MEVQVLFNSAAIEKGLSVGWGFSSLVDNQVLFDTGEKSVFLANNLDRMKINLEKLEAVVISHDHWDHTGGIEEVLKRKAGLDVYICPNFSKGLKQKIVSLKGNLKENSDFCEVAKNIYVTGEIIGTYKQKDIAEQALVLDTNRGLTVITGCAHPDIVEIVEKVREKFPAKPVYAAMGGFHLMNKAQRRINAIIHRFTELGIKKVGPTHCTGTEAENLFRKAYRDNCLTLKVGEKIEV